MDDCSGTIAGKFLKDLNFIGPFYYAQSMQSVDYEFNLTRINAKPGTCFNVQTPTAHTVFEPGSYKQCVMLNYVKNFMRRGLNNIES